MLAGGAPAAEAAGLAAPALGPGPLPDAAARAAAAMAQGLTLSAALEREAALPADLAAFARIGEETGALAALMDRAAAHFAAAAEARAKRLGALAGPTLTAILGVLIGLGAYAMMTAVLDVYDAAL
jgi:type II secretory pathway component PulF